MKFGEYVGFLDQVTKILASMAARMGPPGKSFTCHVRRPEDSTSAKDQEFFFVLRSIVDPLDVFQEGERAAWTTPAGIQDPMCPVVINYHIFAAEGVEEGPAIASVQYGAGVPEAAAQQIYHFIVHGDLPQFGSPTTH